MDTYDLAANLLRQSTSAVSLTGAGISTPSGIADFRTPGTGLWSRVDPATATIQHFLRNPVSFYSWWFSETTAQIFDAEPNPAHFALAELEGKGILRSVVTQNIDGLHQKAGARHVLELHGNCHTATCLSCAKSYQGQVLLERRSPDDPVPYCDCGGLIKPDVVMFGEMLPFDVLQAAQEECSRCDLLLVVGSSLTVTPAADLPWLALQGRAVLVICNIGETWADRYAEVLIQEDVAVSLPAVLERL